MTKKRDNKDSEPRELTVPPSGAILGRIVSTLRLYHPGLRSGTAIRYFRGELIGERRRREILKRLARVRYEADLMPRIPILEAARKRGKDPSVVVAYFLLNRAREWDMQRARIGMWGMKFRRPELVSATLVRQAGLDIALRLAAYLRAAGVCLESECWAWLPPGSRKLIFREYLELWEGRSPSLDELAEATGLAENTIDSWLYEGRLARKDNLRDFCQVLAAGIPGQDPASLQREINLKVAMGTLFDVLVGVMDEETVADAFAHAVRYCYQLTQAGVELNAGPQSSHHQIQGVEISLIAESSMASNPLVTFLVARERSWVWRNLLLGSHMHPLAYWHIVSLLSGSELARSQYQRWIDEGNEISDQALTYAAKNLLTDIRLTVSDMASLAREGQDGDNNSPDFETTLRLVGADAMEMLGGADRSITILQNLVNSHGQSAFLHWRLGRAYASAGMKDRAYGEYWLSAALAPAWEVSWSVR